MERPFWREHLSSITIGLLDVFAIGLGMGVPVFAIALGFPVGWWLARRQQHEFGLQPGDDVPRSMLRTLLVQAAALTMVSFIVLAVIWGMQLPTVFDPTVTASEWGIPNILYTSEASKVGWIVLMLLVSPVLQLAAVLASAMAAFALGRRTPRAA